MIIKKKIIKFLQVIFQMVFYKVRFMFRKINVHYTSAVSFSSRLRLINGGSITVGKNSEISGAVIETRGGSIKIGDYCFIGPFSVVYGHGGLSIGNYVMIAAHSIIIPANHEIKKNGEYMYWQLEKRKGIIIEDDVWIGAGCKILDGVTIRKGSVIGAGSVVTKSTEPYSVNAGVPAKFIKYRPE